MPFILKPKRYAMLRDINVGRSYKSKWSKKPYTVYRSPAECNLVLGNELSVVNFFRSRIQEDIADAAQSKHVNYYHFIVNLDGKSFRELVKHNCYAFKSQSNSILNEGPWNERYRVNAMSSSPWNYKVFKLETVVSNGITLQRQVPMTWHQFFKQCKAVGIEEQCIYKELP